MTAHIDYTRELAAQFRLDDLVAFVPGGYGGIGEAVCWGLALRRRHCSHRGTQRGKSRVAGGGDP